MKKILLMLLLIMLIPSINDAQQFQLEQSIAVKGEDLTTDNLGNWIVINNDQITKFRSRDREPYFYSNKRLGRITSVDATNPLKILVFYKDFSLIVFLDNTLSENGPSLQLQDLNMEQATVVCTSYDNGFWVFDQQNFLLVRYDRHINQTARIKNMHLIVGRTVEPDFMVEMENRLYMNDPKSGIMVFDIFGTYFKTIPIKGLKKFQVTGDYIYYRNENNEFRWFDMKRLNDESFNIPLLTDCCDPRIEKNKLFILRRDTLNIFNIRQ
jgi:hypothetical protein